jgi:hypothetical protein
MRQQATYFNFNFFTVWRIDEGVDYPRFRDLGAHAAPAAVTLEDLDGDGSPEAPYLITNADELNAMRLDLGGALPAGERYRPLRFAPLGRGRGWMPVGASGSRPALHRVARRRGFAIHAT